MFTITTDKNNMKTENNENDDIDNWMPKTSKKTFMLYLLASPILACGAWLLLIWCMLYTDAN